MIDLPNPDLFSHWISTERALVARQERFGFEKPENQSTIHRWAYGGHIFWRHCGPRQRLYLREEILSFPGLPIGNPDFAGNERAKFDANLVKSKIAETLRELLEAYPDGIFRIMPTKHGGAKLVVFGYSARPITFWVLEETAK